MSKNAFCRADPAGMALKEMESYCATHPNSPSAARRPALSIRRGLWIALLGPSVEQGIVGIGFTRADLVNANHCIVGAAAKPCVVSRVA